MRKRDTSDVLFSLVAVVLDAAAAFGGFLLATWIRLDSGWFPVWWGRDPDTLHYRKYSLGAAVAALVFLLVLRSLRLYARPQTGTFESKIPRLVRATGIGVLLAMVLAFAVKNLAQYSTGVILLSFVTIALFLVLERWILFRIEWNVARHSSVRNRVLILGTDGVAARLKRTLAREPMLRSKVIGFLRTGPREPDPDITPGAILGDVDSLAGLVERNEVDQVILTDSRPGHERVLEIMLLCERNLITFNMVPDLFRVMTSNMDVQSLDDIPLLGLSPWPLDKFWNRVVKRAEDVVGAAFGLVVSAVPIGLAALCIKRSSPGPVFYGQERCGERGRLFTIYKLRTMRVDAEAETGPVFASEDDPRTTKVGAFLRRHNIDELPQLWNVLRGDMSLVGPRPERPHFVEQFKEDIDRYMSRHISKPGMTGWAQVNGLRGNTSIQERVKYDLYYLENWSLAFDFKILMRTVFARRNAY